ncbi:MAG: alpha/beta fold hydrolase [Acidobacteriota bacterium]
MNEDNKEINQTPITESTAASWLPKIDREHASRWLKLAGLFAAGAAGSLTLLVGAASFPLSGLLVRPKMKRVAQLKSHRLREFIKYAGIEYEDVQMPSFDGTQLHGWWFESGKDAATVIVIHGVRKNRTDVLRAALALHHAGFNALVFDGRGHGNSEGYYVTYGFNERRDVESVIDWLANHKAIDKTRIGLVGESMGAAIALQVAAANDWIGCVWADSPFASLRRISHEFIQSATRLPNVVLHPVMWTARQWANYRGSFDIEAIEPVALAPQIKCPVYLVHGTGDELIAVRHSQEIYEALTIEKELWIVDGVRHAKAARHAKHDYRERLLKFFKTKLAKSE